MANEPKKRSITGKLVANVLTEREDDFTCNVTYVANRSIKDLCRIRATKGSKYTAAEHVQRSRRDGERRDVLWFYRGIRLYEQLSRSRRAVYRAGSYF
jgi:hypothetical protein